jgi:hypothetical protein
VRPVLVGSPHYLGWRAYEEGPGNYVLVLGAHDGQRWRSDRQSHARFRVGTVFQAVGLNGAAGRFRIGTAEANEEAGGWSAEASGSLPRGVPFLALAGGGAVRPVPRPVRPQPLKNPTYQAAVADLLKAKGVAAPRLRLTRLLRVDLNGDGVDEVLVCAHSREGIGREMGGAQAGDYGLAVLRFVGRAGRVQTAPLALEVYPARNIQAATQRNDVVACADLNGDGKMEVVLASEYYEGGGAAVYAFDGRAVRRVLNAASGL